MFRIASAAVAAAGLVLLAVVPAHADTMTTQSAGQCGDNVYCAFGSSVWTGTVTPFSSCSAAGSTKTISGQSAVNNTDYQVYVRKNGSTVAVLGPGGTLRSAAFTSMTCYTS